MSFTLGRLLSQDVIEVSLGALKLAGGSSLKALGCAPISFQFWHVLFA